MQNEVMVSSSTIAINLFFANGLLFNEENKPRVARIGTARKARGGSFWYSKSYAFAAQVHNQVSKAFLVPNILAYDFL